MAKTTIILNVSGGVVQDVFCSAPEAEVILVDWDTEGCDPAVDGTVEITYEHGRTQQAEILRLNASPLKNLSGTDVQRALERVGLLPDVQRRDESEVRRYILFDFDMDELVTTNVYDTYAEAADDASELDNVIVRTLGFENRAIAQDSQEE